jgi:hypothetical protein
MKPMYKIALSLILFVVLASACATNREKLTKHTRTRMLKIPGQRYPTRITMNTVNLEHRLN